jgi:hypothetical protein
MELKMPANHRSLTELAVRKQSTALNLRCQAKASGLSPLPLQRKAQELEQEAAALLTLDQPPTVGAGGEVIPAQVMGLKLQRIKDTLTEGATRIAEDASCRRTDLLMQPSFNVLPLAIDAADSIGANNSLEKMLAHQMALCHEAVMRFADRAFSYEASRPGESVEAARLMNISARLMSTFQEGLITLQRIRSGGNQTMRIEHVHVHQGAQAVIGNVKEGWGRGRRTKPKNG